MNPSTPLALLTYLFLFSTTAHAALITDKSVYEDAISDAIVDDYSDSGYSSHQSDAEMSAVIGETSYTATGFLNNNLVLPNPNLQGNPYYCAGCNGSFILDFTSTSIGTSSGVFGAGFNFYNQGTDLLYTAFVTFGDGSTMNYGLPSEPFFTTSAFFGITSDIGVSSIALGLPDGQTTHDGSFGLDNLTIGCDPTSAGCLPEEVSAVPAPAPLALLGLGLLGLWTTRPRSS
ncbi:MAG: hypothetical protein WED00_13350 [Aquisalimonadaceae bacterium]